MLRRNSNQPHGRVIQRGQHSESERNSRNAPNPPTRLSRESGNLTTSSGVRRKVVVLHDGTHDNFDPSLFASRYDVRMVRCPSLRQATAVESIINQVESATPHMVLVHLGSKDIYEGRPMNSMLSEIKSLSLRLTGFAHTCVSLPIVPQTTVYNGFSEKITEFNDSTAEMISSWRRYPPRGMTKKIFTCNKPMMAPMVKVVAEEPHIAINSPNGRAKLWLKLRDALDRMAGLLPPRKRNQTTGSGRTNEQSPPQSLPTTGEPAPSTSTASKPTNTTTTNRTANGPDNNL